MLSIQRRKYDSSEFLGKVSKSEKA